MFSCVGVDVVGMFRVLKETNQTMMRGNSTLTTVRTTERASILHLAEETGRGGRVGRHVFGCGRFAVRERALGGACIYRVCSTGERNNVR